MAATETATTVQTVVQELTSAAAAPTATFFVPVLLDTDVPPQISSPVSTLTLSPTSVPIPPMVIVPAGSFLMGSNNGNPDEKPAHMIHVDTFYIDKYEVTNSMYSYCVGSGTCQRPVIEEGGAPRNYYGPEYSSYPVIYVSWEMARTYCETWRGARLPTEAEWEKAARGGLAEMLYPWGNEPPNCQAGARNGARYSGCSEKGTVKVGSFSPNDYQIYDMAGNLWEWVSDWYRSDYYSQAAANSPNPQGPAAGEDRVLRGGSWNNTNIQAANRGFAPPATQDNEIGFRCAKDAVP
jgi:formylglycine-generating enzyme required for sulfatase activity